MIHGLVFREKYKYNHLEEIKSEENKLMSIKKSQCVLQNKKCFSICCKMKKQNKKGEGGSKVVHSAPLWWICGDAHKRNPQSLNQINLCLFENI